MKQFRKTLFHSTLVVMFLNVLVTLPAMAGEHMLQPKLGIVDWSDSGPHSVKGNSFTLDSDASPSLGFMYLYRLDNGFAFGGEVFGYKKDFTHSNGNTGEADFGHVYGLAEYYFNNQGTVKPFVGIGLGSAGVTFTGAIDHDTRGPSVQIKAGAEFEINERFAISAEAKYFAVDFDEEINNQKADIKSNGFGLFAGFTIKI